MSVDTLLNWADIGTKAHTSERLTSLLRQMPLRFGGEQKQALICLVKSNENSGRGHGGMQKIATHGSIQKNVMDAMVKEIAMGVSNQRMTNTVGNHCATEIVKLSYFSRVDRCGTDCSRVPS